MADDAFTVLNDRRAVLAERALVAWLRECASATPDTRPCASPEEAAALVAPVLEGLLARAAVFHARLDRWIALALRPVRDRVACAKSCAVCCRHYVCSVEPFEHLRLYAALRETPGFAAALERAALNERRFAPLWERAERAAAAEAVEETGKPEHDDLFYDGLLQRYYELRLPCPVFSAAAGTCGRHDARPASCRLYFALDDPKFCEPENLRAGAGRGFLLELPDAVEEAIGEWSGRLEGLDLGDRMADALLRLNVLDGILFGATSACCGTPGAPSSSSPPRSTPSRG